MTDPWFESHRGQLTFIMTVIVIQKKITAVARAAPLNRLTQPFTLRGLSHFGLLSKY